MQTDQLKHIIEAVLLASDRAVSLKELLNLFRDSAISSNIEDIKKAMEQLQTELLERSFELQEVAGGYHIQIRQEYTDWIQKMLGTRPPKYSRSFLETLAIISYKQPITRAEIEEIRGVSVSSTIMKGLRGRGWIKTVGYKNIPGKPELLATTNDFLNYFGLKSIDDLPVLENAPDIYAQDDINENHTADDLFSATQDDA